MGIATFRRVERANGFCDIGGEGVDADLELDQIGGRPPSRGGGAGAIAQRLNGSANTAGIGRSEREFLAIDLDGFAIDVGGNLAVGAGGDAGYFRETEVGVAELGVLTDEAIGVLAADAGIFLAKFVPGEAEVVEHFGIADLAETLSAGSRATAGDDGEGLLESDPGAEIDLFLRVHARVWETIVAESEEGLFQPNGLARGLRLVRSGA